MQIIRVALTDPRIPTGANAPRIVNNQEAYFPIGSHARSGAVFEVAVAIEDGLLVFLPDRAHAHQQVMDALGIGRGRYTAVEGSMAVEPLAEAAQATAIATDQAAIPAIAALPKPGIPAL